ncbi:MAG: hypothetical protein HC830_14000, partial [Bacteroidetes bacterium]|nr:hypothetical protein [Bacteroidota bacterium]
FPIKEKKIGLPSGAIAGQNIYNLLNQLASPVYRETNFLKFPIPFICVATDIEKAKPVVFSNGYLPEVMRASMAIPSLFTPEIIDGDLYVDGGVLNNFPVLEVKKMGVDIIIGVDVGFRPLSRKSLNTISAIITQSMYTFTKAEMDKNRDACELLISPALDGYHVLSFNDADSIIAHGERAAMDMLPQIKALADSLNNFIPGEEPRKFPERFTSVIVKEIEISGLNYVPKDFILRKLQIPISSEISLKDLESSIALVYGTQFFNKITYRLEPLDNGTKIILEVSERTTNYFRVGIHYDSNFKTALLLNNTFRNIPVPGSKLTLDLALGENIAFNGLLYFNSGWNPDKIQTKKKQIFPDFGIRANSHKMEVFEYEDESRAASYDFFDFTLDLFWQWNISNYTALGGGITGDYSSISNKVGKATLVASDYFHTNFHFFYKIDNYNEDFFPNRGVQLTSSFKYVKGLSSNLQDTKGFFQGSVRYAHAVSLYKRLTLTNSLFAGFSSIDIVPAHYGFYMGGMGGTYLRGLVPFVGLKYMQISGSNAWSAGTDLRYEIWGNNFVSLKANICNATFAIKDLFVPEDITYGGGISYGYRSVIGPMEITFMTSNHIKGLSGFINIGYWF